LLLKKILTLAFLLLTANLVLADASNAIVFISPEAVGRAIKPEDYNHGLWIQWPLPTTVSGSNRLLSPITGKNWSLPRDPFKGSSVDSPLLHDIGVLDAKKSWLGAASVVDAQSNDDLPELALMSIDDQGVARSQSLSEIQSNGSLVIYHAANWDDVAFLQKRVRGNVLVISYPPAPESTLSAAWFMGKAEIPGITATGIPVMVSSREIVGFVSHPQTYGWRPPTDVNAETWMKVINSTRSAHFLVFSFLVVIAFLWALRSVAVQSGGKLARLGLSMIPCAFVAMILSGNFAKATGVTPWNILPFFAFFALMLGLLPAYLGMRALWPKSHPLFPVALIASILLIWADPTYTVFSNVFTSSPVHLSAVPLGVLVACLTASVAFCIRGETWPRVLAALLLCTAMLLGVLTKQWWSPDTYLLILPVLAILCGAGAMRLYLLPLFVVWPFLYDHWNGHFAWDMGWLLTRNSDEHAINAAAQMQFLLSPTFLVALCGFVACFFVGGDFLRHQLRRTLSENNNASALFWCALAVAGMGIREPYLLESALAIAIAGALVLLFDAAGSI